MMYWPLSMFEKHPDLNPAYRHELALVYQHTHGISDAAMWAVHAIASNTDPAGANIRAIQSIGAPIRMEYASMPDEDEFRRLERGSFYSNGASFFLHVGALH